MVKKHAFYMESGLMLIGQMNLVLEPTYSTKDGNEIMLKSGEEGISQIC